MDSFIPRVRNTSLAAFGQGFALKLSKKQDVVAVKDKIIHNLIKYLTNIKANKILRKDSFKDISKESSVFYFMEFDKIPSFFIYPTKYLEFEVYTNYKNYAEDDKNKRKTGDLIVSLNIKSVRVDSKYLEDNPAFNPSSILKHGVFRQTV